MAEDARLTTSGLSEAAALLPPARQSSAGKENAAPAPDSSARTAEDIEWDSFLSGYSLPISVSHPKLADDIPAVLRMCQFSACATGLLHQLVCLLPLPIAPPLRFAVGSAPALSSQPGARGSAAAGPASTSSLHCTQSGSVPHVGCQQTMSKHSRGDGRSATAAVSPDFVAPPSTQANLTAVGASGADTPMPAAPQSSPPGTAQAALPGCPSPTREVQVSAALLPA